MSKVSTRTVRADNGYARRTTVVTRNGRVVEDDRNGIVILDPQGNQVAVLPQSAQTLANDASWLAGRVQAAA